MGITTHLLLHMPISHNRDDNNQVTEMQKPGTRGENHVDTVFLIEIDRQTSKDEIKAIRKELISVMEEISLAVSDWKPMRERLKDVSNEVLITISTRAIKSTQKRDPAFLELAGRRQLYINWLSCV